MLICHEFWSNPLSGKGEKGYDSWHCAHVPPSTSIASNWQCRGPEAVHQRLLKFYKDVFNTLMLYRVNLKH